jgi:hypothetical protein
MLLRHPPVAVDDLRRLRFLTVPCQENPSPRMSRCCSAGTHGSTLSRRDILQRGLQSADRCRRSSCQTRATALTPLPAANPCTFAGAPVDRPIADCAACWNCITMWNQSRVGGFVKPASTRTDRRPGQPSVNAVSSVRPTAPRFRRISAEMSVPAFKVDFPKADATWRLRSDRHGFSAGPLAGGDASISDIRYTVGSSRK